MTDEEMRETLRRALCPCQPKPCGEHESELDGLLPVVRARLAAWRTTDKRAP